VCYVIELAQTELLVPACGLEVKEHRYALLWFGIDGDATACFKLHIAVNQGEEGVVASDADIFARMEFCSALANYYGACADELSPERLNAQIFRV